jgi:hypothetical protein
MQATASGRAGGGNNQISLPAQEGWNLHQIDHRRDGLCLIDFVNVGRDRNI